MDRSSSDRNENQVACYPSRSRGKALLDLSMSVVAKGLRGHSVKTIIRWPRLVFGVESRIS